MNIIVEGVSIELTESQVSLLKKEKAKRAKRAYSGFAKTLKHFGFIHKKDVNTENEPIEWYEHPKHGWRAEILDRGNWKEVWLVGKCLKDSGFPGGHIYSNSKELAEEILIALNN